VFLLTKTIPCEKLRLLAFKLATNVVQALPHLEQKLVLAASYLEHFLEELLQSEANLLRSYVRSVDMLSDDDRKTDLFEKLALRLLPYR